MVESVQFSGDLLKDLKTDDNNTLKSDDLDLVNFIFKKDYELGSFPNSFTPIQLNPFITIAHFVTNFDQIVLIIV